MSWYRTYRPQTFASLHITPVKESFLRILETGNFSHAYLLSGPKGTGKTSAARILAKVLNCVENRPNIEKILAQHSTNPSSLKTTDKKSGISLQEPCNICSSCIAITNGSSMSVTEIDAASNRGIDDIRALRERIGLSAPDGLVAVYIIDEVHMLTNEAFNALLKVLEEPPAHVVFVLATTDPQKMPATVISRCTLVQYRKATSKELTAALEEIARLEGIVVDPPVLERVAILGDGSFRDSVKTLENLSVGKKTLTLKDVEAILGEPLSLLSTKLLNALMQKSSIGVMEVFTILEDKGMDGVAFQKDVLATAQQRLIEYVTISDKRWTKLLAVLQKIAVPLEPAIPIPWMPFELACLAWTVGEADSVQSADQHTPSDGKNTATAKPVEKKEKELVQAVGQTMKKEKEEEKTVPEKQVETPPEKSGSVSTSKKADLVKPKAESFVPVEFSVIESKWTAILQAVRVKSTPVEGLLRSTRPVKIEENTLYIEAAYQFHKEQLELDRNRLVIEAVIESVLGNPVRTSFTTSGKGIVMTSAHSNISGKVDDEGLIKAAEDAFL